MALVNRCDLHDPCHEVFALERPHRAGRGSWYLICYEWVMAFHGRSAPPARFVRFLSQMLRKQHVEETPHHHREVDREHRHDRPVDPPDPLPEAPEKNAPQ